MEELTFNCKEIGMLKEEVISELCALAAVVADHIEIKKGHLPAHDCFCSGALGGLGDYQFDRQVMAIIKVAVTKYLGACAKVDFGTEKRFGDLLQYNITDSNGANIVRVINRNGSHYSIVWCQSPMSVRDINKVCNQIDQYTFG